MAESDANAKLPAVAETAASTEDEPPAPDAALAVPTAPAPWARPVAATAPTASSFAQLQAQVSGVISYSTSALHAPNMRWI